MSREELGMLRPTEAARIHGCCYGCGCRSITGITTMENAVDGIRVCYGRREEEGGEEDMRRSEVGVED